MVTVLFWILAVVLVIIGFAGTVLPALPGAPLVFLGLFVAAWGDSFQHVGWPTLVVLGVLTAFVLIVDLVATAMGAKRVGASRLAILGAAIGTLIGIFFALPGIILGPFIGATAGEYLARARLGDATKVGLGTWIGLLIGTILKLTILFIMAGIFITAWFF